MGIENEYKSEIEEIFCLDPGQVLSYLRKGVNDLGIAIWGTSDKDSDRIYKILADSECG